MRQIFRLAKAKTGKTAASSPHRSAGDVARDRHEWGVAADRYRSHVDAHPNDAAIWVQLGHAHKENGKLDAAEHAYRQAAKVDPENVDAAFQLGHVLKRRAKRAEAIVAFRQAFELAPSRSIYDEIVALGGSRQTVGDASLTSRANAPDVVLFEVNDLVGWLHQYLTLSGIQRVQVGIVQNVLAEVLNADEGKYAFVCASGDRRGIWQFWPEDLRDVLDYAAKPEPERAELTRLLHKAEQAAIEVKPAEGQCYFILGAFWGFNPDNMRFAALKKAGVRIGVYIYDLIPITHPEFCDTHLCREFLMSLSDGLAVFDFVLTISDFVAKDVLRLQREHRLPSIPVHAVPLAHVMTEEPIEVADSEWTPAIEALEGRRFVLSVSTIEGRKNHGYLIAAWRLMISEGLDVPDLVFVGRQGWRVNDLMEQIKASDYLDGRVHILHGITDAELSMLYSHCQFTAFPSIVEGWGLPVGESLAHGRPCVASNTSSIPEVGGDLVDYIDPFNVRSGVEGFRRMAFDDAYRAKREQNIRKNFSPRSWGAVTEDLLEKLHAARSEGTPTMVTPRLQPGELFSPGRFTTLHPIPKLYLERPMRTVLHRSWYPPEGFGAWMNGRSGGLRFDTGLAAGTAITVFVRLIGPPWPQTMKVAVTADASTPVDAAASGEVDDFMPNLIGLSGEKLIRTGGFTVQVNGTVQENGLVVVDLLATGERDDRHIADKRYICVGLVACAYTTTDDAEGRVAIAEALSEL